MIMRYLVCWMLVIICASAFAQDINLDGQVDCDDSELLGAAIRDGITDARFDLDGNAAVEMADHVVWRDAAFAESSHFQLVAVPQLAPDKLLRTKLIVRATNPSDLVAIFHNVAFRGDAHQVGLPIFVQPMATVDSFDHVFGLGDELVDELQSLDSHVLVRPETVGYGLYNGYYGLTDRNDASNPTDAVEIVHPALQLSFAYGFGDLGSENPDFDLFALSSPVISEIGMANSVEFAQLITPVRMPTTGEPGKITIRLGVAGGTSDLEVIDDFPVFGLDEEL